MAIISDFEEPTTSQDNQNQQSLPPKSVAKVAEDKNQQKEDKQKNMLLPNTGNGLDMDNYSWTQTLKELTVTVPVPYGTKCRQVLCEIKRTSLKVGLKGQSPILEGELFQPVIVGDCFWSLEDQEVISVLLTKCDQMDWWSSLFKGSPEIDTQKVEPGSSKLSDLDGETRAAVEKMMFDQRQKQMGLPTSEEIRQQEIMKQFMAQHPNMDFSKVKMMGKH